MHTTIDHSAHCVTFRDNSSRAMLTNEAIFRAVDSSYRLFILLYTDV